MTAPSEAETQERLAAIREQPVGDHRAGLAAARAALRPSLDTVQDQLASMRAHREDPNA